MLATAKKSDAADSAAEPRPRLVLAAEASSRSDRLLATAKKSDAADSAAEPRPRLVLAAEASSRSDRLFEARSDPPVRPVNVKGVDDPFAYCQSPLVEVCRTEILTLVIVPWTDVSVTNWFCVNASTHECRPIPLIVSTSPT